MMMMNKDVRVRQGLESVGSLTVRLYLTLFDISRFTRGLCHSTSFSVLLLRLCQLWLKLTKMGTKRPRTHHADNIHPSRQVNHQPAKPFRQKLSNPVQTFTSSTSINPIKGKIRNLVRLLERPGELPPGVRIEKERALTGYRQDLEKANEEKRKQQMIKKYHMVRFFGTLILHQIDISPWTKSVC